MNSIADDMKLIDYFTQNNEQYINKWWLKSMQIF